ncbi:phage tail protein [Amycolatopsis sp. BJA-103]|uniref:phage tail protein n=1 Tax=unclassified Amycolatopsis TaxID=2618356 RepID=UPI000C785C2A|nr:phage tail protein [Amycolatopsis sp. BJA-103]AUI58318.1 hypothetical protein BKN51_08860 [Amycolatopsis sp. BJA-103]PNE14818.1 hypothetical protein B1H26_33250 [Amycolatopsis sp. BJA-103]
MIHGKINSAAAAAGLSPARSGAKTRADRYGMTMWFNVIVPDLDGSARTGSLGLWSGCSGLDVQFAPEGPLDEAGSYDSPRYLPGKITYGKVTLERAMTTAGSLKVRRWLQQQVADWLDGGGGPRRDRPAITVQLFSGLSPEDHVVHTWKLRDAMPVSWSVPTLSSSGGGIAIEKLSFVHNGFLDTAAVAGGRPTGERARLRITEAQAPATGVTFHCSPAKFSLNQSRQVKLKEGKTYRDGAKVVDDDALSLKLNDLLLEGTDDVQDGITKLKKWLEPLPDGKPVSSVPPPISKDAKPLSCGQCGQKPPSTRPEARYANLTLSLGADVAYLPSAVVLKSIDVNFTRFTADGKPSRAVIGLVLQEKPGTKGRP